MTSSDAPATPPTAPPATPAKTRLSVRAIAAVVCLVLGLGLLPLGMLTYWGHRTVTDSERYIETMSPLAYDAEVQDSLAVFLTDKIEEQIDAEAIVAQIFGDLLAERPALNALVPVVTGAIDSLITEVVNRLVRSDQFEKLWDAANVALKRV